MRGQKVRGKGERRDERENTSATSEEEREEIGRLSVVILTLSFKSFTGRG